MDENKLKVLKEVGYVMYKTCDLCEHFRQGASSFGTCKVHLYEHLKHNGPPREMSVNKSGGCPDWELDETAKEGSLGHYIQFIPNQK